MSSITIYNRQSVELWKKNISDDEFNALRVIINESNHSEKPWKNLVMPINTYSIRRFAQDTFFPILVNCLIESDRRPNLVECVFCLVVEISTLPIRLLTCIPRIFWNLFQPENQLLRYLRVQNCSANILGMNHVKVKLTGPIITVTRKIISEIQIPRTYPEIKAIIDLKTNYSSIFYNRPPHVRSIFAPMTAKIEMRIRAESKIKNSNPNSKKRLAWL